METKHFMLSSLRQDYFCKKKRSRPLQQKCNWNTASSGFSFDSGMAHPRMKHSMVRNSHQIKVQQQFTGAPGTSSYSLVPLGPSSTFRPNQGLTICMLSGRLLSKNYFQFPNKNLQKCSGPFCVVFRGWFVCFLNMLYSCWDFFLYWKKSHSYKPLNPLLHLKK